MNNNENLAHAAAKTDVQEHSQDWIILVYVVDIYIL